MPNNLPDPNIFIGLPIPDLAGYKIVELVGSGANAHVFRGHSEEMNQDVAVKIIPKNMLKSNWEDEFLKANSLRLRMAVQFYHRAHFIHKDANFECALLVSDYIDGTNLKKYVKQNKTKITINFIDRFLRSILNLFHEMQNSGIQHGDLHAGNILIEDQSSSLIEPGYSFWVTDFGVASTTGGSFTKDDYIQLTFLLKQLISNVDYQVLDPRDKFVYNILVDHYLSRHLTENDKTIDPLARNPQGLYKKLINIDSEYTKRQTTRALNTLYDPFEYLSCELFGEEHSLLKSLYSNRFLGLTDIEGRNNLVLTGPRGCGKSTVFKSLSLKHRVKVDDDAPGKIKYLGIYYRCDDLYFSFPRYKIPEREEAFNLPMHFLTSTLLYELIELLHMWGKKYFNREISDKELQITRQVSEALEVKDSKKLLLTSLRDLIPYLQKQRKRATYKQRFVEDPKHQFGYYYGPDVLFAVVSIIKKNLSFLKKIPFYFFIDDYSSPKITMSLQQNLNRILMQRNPDCFFKMSTESPVSYSKKDIDGKAFVEKREYFMLNLGLIYIEAHTKEKLRFVEDVFNRRLGAVPDYPAKDFSDLVGSIARPNYNQAAREIRQNKRIKIWGKESICAICSGDIHTVIDLVRRMVNKAGGRNKLSNVRKAPKVSINNQTIAVREQAGDFLKGLRDLPEGSHLVEIVTAFGNVAYSFLKFRNSGNEKNNPPWQAHRIEPFEQLKLSEKAQQFYNELLRFSVFIEDLKGKSRRGKVVPRLFLRRLLIPHFNLTFSRRDSVPLEAEEIELLLIEPNQFEKKHRLKKPSTNTEGSKRHAQHKLPGF